MSETTPTEICACGHHKIAHFFDGAQPCGQCRCVTYWEGHVSAGSAAVPGAAQVAPADAWDEGYEAGHEDARCVQAAYPLQTPNPYRAQRGDRRTQRDGERGMSGQDDGRHEFRRIGHGNYCGMPIDNGDGTYREHCGLLPGAPIHAPLAAQEADDLFPHEFLAIPRIWPIGRPWEMRCAVEGCRRTKDDPIHRCADCGEPWHPHRTEVHGGRTEAAHEPWNCGQHHRRTAPLANGGEGEFCCACSHEFGDYVWPCAAGDAATDVDSTAEDKLREIRELMEAAENCDGDPYGDGCFVGVLNCKIRAILDRSAGQQNAAQVDRTALREQGPLQPGRHEFEPAVAVFHYADVEMDECALCDELRDAPVHRCPDCGEAWHPHRTEVHGGRIEAEPAETDRLKRWQRIAQNWMGVARAQGAKLAAVHAEVGENNCWCEDEDVLCVHCRVRAALTAGPPTWPQCGHTGCDCPIEPGRCENCGNQMRDHVQADGLLSCYPRSAVAGVPAAGDAP